MIDPQSRAAGDVPDDADERPLHRRSCRRRHRRVVSPALHETAADRLGLRYVYQVIDLDDLDLDASAIGELLADAQRLGFRGLNVTHPCKQLVLEWLDDLAPGAVCTAAQ